MEVCKLNKLTDNDGVSTSKKLNIIYDSDARVTETSEPFGKFPKHSDIFEKIQNNMVYFLLQRLDCMTAEIL